MSEAFPQFGPQTWLDQWVKINGKKARFGYFRNNETGEWVGAFTTEEDLLAVSRGEKTTEDIVQTFNMTQGHIDMVLANEARIAATKPQQ